MQTQSLELTVHITPNVVKQLKNLEKGGGNAAQAAEHAREVMNRAVAGIRSPKELGRLTKYGEARIPNCIKFDLIRGYRLIAVWGKKDMHFLFLGSHDECDHWLKNNYRLEVTAETRAARVLHAKSKTDELPAPSPMREFEDEIEADDYDAILLGDLTDADLREIFCGLCKKRA